MTYLLQELRTTFEDADPECIKGNHKNVIVIILCPSFFLSLF